MPQLSPTSGPTIDHSAGPTFHMSWKTEPKLYGELNILSSWKPPQYRGHQLSSIIYWDHDRSGLVILDYSDPSQVRAIHDWPSSPENSFYGVHSGTLQTVDIRGLAVRAGRRFLSHLQRGSHDLEFRLLAYMGNLAESKPCSIPVLVPDNEWDQAEAFDSCTIFGRILIRQYDPSSDSEYSDSAQFPKIAAMDFT